MDSGFKFPKEGELNVRLPASTSSKTTQPPQKDDQDLTFE
jgi:hypothetical protein